MAILVDDCRWPFRGRLWCHLVSDVSYTELHAFAKAIGKPRVAFQGDHYDLHEHDRMRAIELGAMPTEGRELVRRLNTSGLRRGPGLKRGGLAAVAHLPAPEIQTQRLLLRQWREADRVAFRSMSADADVMKFLGGVRSAEEADVQIDARATTLAIHGFGKWAVEELASGEFVGTVGLDFALFEATFTPAIEMGWRLTRPHWGRGFALEAATAALDYGFDELDLREIVAFTSVGNHASRKIMERLGMEPRLGEEFDGPSRDPDDEHRRKVLYSITRAARSRRVVEDGVLGCGVAP